MDKHVRSATDAPRLLHFRQHTQFDQRLLITSDDYFFSIQCLLNEAREMCLCFVDCYLNHAAA